MSGLTREDSGSIRFKVRSLLGLGIPHRLIVYQRTNSIGIDHNAKNVCLRLRNHHSSEAALAARSFVATPQAELMT
jgi:hypothetical protein